MAEIFWPFSTALVTEWPGTRPAGWAPHVGTDFGVAQGTPVRATMAGRIDIVWNDGYGAWIINIINPDGTVIRNGHMSYMHVKDGQWVNAGDYIGNSGGARGTAGAGLSTGPHLHWEIRTNNGWSNAPGNWYDPRHLTIKSFDTLTSNAQAAKARKRKKEKDMVFIYRKIAGGAQYALFRLGQKGAWMEFTGQDSANQLASQYGSAMFVVDSYWEHLKKMHA